MLRSAAMAFIAMGVIFMTSSCSWVSSWFGDDDPAKPTSVSVFDAAVGECFIAPKDVESELSDLQKVPCDVDHQQELFAKVSYVAPAGAAGAAANLDIPGDTYPGDAALDTFAKGACAEAFTAYVGIAYPDSGLWMTYLLPSARSWQQGEDRGILCFVTTTGGSLTNSVKGSKL